MIQFNLLPKTKEQYVKVRRTQRLVVLIAIIASAASLFVFILTLVTVDVIQKKTISSQDDKISAASSRLKNIKDLDKILTVQNQLNTLTSLHDQKVVASRLFGYAAKVTPDKVTISNLSIDFGAHTIAITGQAPDLDTVNVYTDTLKATNYSLDSDSKASKKAFSGVVLSSFGRSTKGSSYSINASFDPAIFDSQSAVNLTVPSGIQSNSAKLFQQAGS